MDTMQKRGASYSPSVSPSSAVNPAYSSGGNGGGNLRTTVPKSLGMSRRGVRNNFIPPVRSNVAGGGAATTSRLPGNVDNGLEESTKRWLVTYSSIVAYSENVAWTYRHLCNVENGQDLYSSFRAAVGAYFVCSYFLFLLTKLFIWIQLLGPYFHNWVF
jgi:hypothetical protein